MGSHGRLIDTSLLRALLVPSPGGTGALDWLERVGDGQAAHRLLDGFLVERCPVVCFEPDDFAMVRHRQRHRPGIAALPLLLQLQLAYRLGLLPVTFDRELVAAADALSYPVETPCVTSSAWGAASRKPSCS